ncbi:MAG: gamma-glutamyltransferase [Flavobacteriales bacterium]|nr:gamma-glutamyltransferase [Flavobacteriales bacterium]
MNKYLFYKVVVITLLFFAFFSCENSNDESDNQSLITKPIIDSAMVVSAHPLASKVGVDVMEKGGNAIDAAIAVQFALAVVYPSAGNIGGGGFMVVRLAEGQTNTLDFREKSPSKSTRDMYLDENGDVIPDLSLLGHLAVGVPGTVDGMVNAHEKYGSLSWNDLVQPSIDLAKNGFVLTNNEAGNLNYYLETKSIFNTIDSSLYKTKWNPGDTIVLNDLSETLKRIRDHKRAGFYEGKTADLIIEEINRGEGIVSYEDLKSYESIWREPIVFTYKYYKMISMDLPSSGGVVLNQMFKMIESFPLSSLKFHSPEYIHLLAEAERRSFADRSKFLGDPDFVSVPKSVLLDSNYILNRMNSYDPSKSSKSSDIFPGNVLINESEETTHYSIVDQYGNAVSVTTTLNGSFGSGVVVGGGGFLLNNEMDDFSSKPGTPNLYGLVGGEANSIQPNKRMLSSMTPTIVEKNGKLFMVVGTPGGSTIITGVFQTILNVIEFNMTMDEAVEAPRFHHQWLPDQIKIEKSLSKDSNLCNQLMNLGHKLKPVGSMNRVDAILIDDDGILQGGADSRGDDAALGF